MPIELTDILVSMFGGAVLAITCYHVPYMIESKPPKTVLHAHYLATTDLRRFLKKYSWLFGMLFTIILLAVFSID